MVDTKKSEDCKNEYIKKNEHPFEERKGVFIFPVSEVRGLAGVLSDQ